MDAILNNSKRSMIPAGHHSDSDSTVFPLPKSSITWFGGIFARLPPLAAGLLCHMHGKRNKRIRNKVFSLVFRHRERRKSSKRIKQSSLPTSSNEDEPSRWVQTANFVCRYGFDILDSLQQHIGETGASCNKMY